MGVGAKSNHPWAHLSGVRGGGEVRGDWCGGVTLGCLHGWFEGVDLWFMWVVEGNHPAGITHRCLGVVGGGSRVDHHGSGLLVGVVLVGGGW